MFDPALYETEMKGLVDSSVKMLQQARPSVLLFTASIWTDPNGAVSAVSFDTAENSAARTAKDLEFSAREYAKYVAAGDTEMARLFSRPDGAHRNTNPADFAFRDICSIEHSSFATGWEDQTEGRCWDELEPALLRIREYALDRYSQLPHHPKARLAMNSQRDWYDHEVSLNRSAL